MSTSPELDSLPAKTKKENNFSEFFFISRNGFMNVCGRNLVCGRFPAVGYGRDERNGSSTHKEHY